jgi:hypothetical protein
MYFELTVIPNFQWRRNSNVSSVEKGLSLDIYQVGYKLK